MSQYHDRSHCHSSPDHGTRDRQHRCVVAGTESSACMHALPRKHFFTLGILRWKVLKYIDYVCPSTEDYIHIITTITVKYGSSWSIWYINHFFQAQCILLYLAILGSCENCNMITFNAFAKEFWCIIIKFVKTPVETRDTKNHTRISVSFSLATQHYCVLKIKTICLQGFLEFWNVRFKISTSSCRNVSRLW